MKTKVAIAVGLLLAGGSAWAQQYLIRTVAGGGLPITPAVATSLALETTTAVTADAAGNLYFDSGSSVLKVDTSGALTVVAGSSTLAGYAGDGGAATDAQLMQPSGLDLDSAGNLYIADAGNNVIRKVAAMTGLISTVAGNGTPGYSGDGALATVAQLGHPRYVVVDVSGNLFISDSDNNVIRKVTAATGLISTVAGNGTAGYSGDGTAATSANLSPSGLAVDGAGNLYVSDAGNSVVRKVTAATGIITTVAGTGTAGLLGDGGLATSARLSGPQDVAVDAAGNLYIADSGNLRIRKVAAATGLITTVAGGGTNGFTSGPATGAQLTGVPSVTLDGLGNLYIADGNVIRKVTVATAAISTLAGNGKPGFAGYTGDGGPATSAQLSAAQGVAVDRLGNLYISDSSNYVIREVASATGTITTVAGNGLPGYTGDGGPATGARIVVPFGAAVDGAGNIYFADSNVVREVVAATGFIKVVAGNGTTGNSGDGGPQPLHRRQLQQRGSQSDRGDGHHHEGGRHRHDGFYGRRRPRNQRPGRAHRRGRGRLRQSVHRGTQPRFRSQGDGGNRHHHHRGRERHTGRFGRRRSCHQCRNVPPGSGGGCLRQPVHSGLLHGNQPVWPLL